MPIYEYQCQECGHVFEEMHSMHVRLRNYVCPRCDQWARVKRLISRSTFILDGVRWERDGYQGRIDAQSRR